MDEAVSSKPWISHPHIWKSEAEFICWVRGGLRKLWANHPIRTEFKKKHQTTMVNTNKRSMKRFPTVAAWKCSICHCLTKDIQIDHISDTGGTFISMDDIQKYAEYLYFVTDENLRCVCKPCHDIVSYSQKQGISYEEAVIEKKIISMLKKENISSTVDFLSEHGYNNVKAKDRRDILRKVLKGE